jgi:IclR family KDG regulon transcriptional repressor
MGQKVQSLERGVQVLELVVRNGPMGVTNIATELSLDKTIVHRLLTTLQALGYVQQDNNRRYTVGTRLKAVGAKVLFGLNVRTLALPFMNQLAEHTRCVSHLAKMAESRAVYIERVEFPGLTISSTDVGGESPGYCSAAGKVLWAYLPERELNEILDSVNFRSHTPNTITDRNALKQHLAIVRDQGFALDNEEHRIGLVGVGAPVRDYSGNVIASICVAELNYRSTPQTLERTRELVQEAAQALSAEMGFINGTNF